jgi:tetratricopeptide (TPR) repeat protein
MTRLCAALLLLSAPVAALAGEKEWEAAYKEGEKLLVEQKYADAEAKFKAALKEAERWSATDERLTNTLTAYADALRGGGKLAEAEAQYKKALEALEKALGGDDPGLAGALADMGDVCRDQDKDSKAEPYYRRALKVLEKSTEDKESVDAALAALDLGSCLLRMKKVKDAEPLLKKASEVLGAAKGVDPEDLLDMASAMGDLRMAQGKPEHAEPHYRKVVDGLEGKDKQDLAGALRDWAGALRGMKKDKEADAAEARAKELEGK